MGEVAAGGRTVLFVSHQMTAIRHLCKRVIWIHDGHVKEIGETPRVVSAYEGFMIQQRQSSEGSREIRGSKAHFIGWRIIEPEEPEPNILRSFGPVIVEFIAEVKEQITCRLHSVALFSDEGTLIWANGVRQKIVLPPGRHSFVYKFPMLPLRPGIYRWVASLYDDSGMLDEWHALPEFLIATEPVESLADKWSGLLNLRYEFGVRHAADDL
jgi:hypothetical protein